MGTLPLTSGAISSHWDRRTGRRSNHRPKPSEGFCPKPSTPASTVQQELLAMLEANRDTGKISCHRQATEILNRLNPGNLRYNSALAFMAMCRVAADALRNKGRSEAYLRFGLDAIGKMLEKMEVN